MINKSNSRLGLVGSLALHSALFGGVWAMLSQPKPQLLEETTSISLELIAARLEQPQVAVAPEIDPQAQEEVTEVEPPLPEPEKIVEPEPEPVVEPIALPKPEPKPEPKPKEKPKLKEKPKEPPKPKKEVEKEKPKEKPKSESTKAEKPKTEPKKMVKALEKGTEAKQGIVSKAVPNAFQGTKVQAGIPNGSANGNHPSINQAGSPNGNTNQAGQNSSEHNAYRATLQRALQQRANSSYPQREKMMRKMGTVVLKFTLTPTGQITNVQVQKSSGNDNLDAAAVKAAQSTNPPTPPTGFPSAITVPVKFVVQ